MIEVIYLANDTLLELRDLRAETTGALMEGATVTAVLKDAAGTTVATISLLEVEAGLYRGTLPYSTALTLNARYTATITADAGAGRRGTWTVPVLVKAR